MKEEKETEIDRQQVRKAFAEYTVSYDVSDPKIKLKVDHTYRVAALCQSIGESLQLSKADLDLVWMIGMLHDIGRFEQLRRFGTFVDSESIDHARFGVELLFQEPALLKKFYSGSMQLPEMKILRTAIWNHSAYRIEDGLDERTLLFSKIIRDADKIDILRVNYEVPLEDIYNVTTEELHHAPVTPEVEQAFYEHHCVLRSLKKTPIDNVVGHASLVFELEYPVSKQIVARQGYLWKMLAYPSENEDTIARLHQMTEELEHYLDQDSARS